MNPLELVTKTLYSFEEKELTIKLLKAFGKRAETFEQYNDIAKIFFEIKNLPNGMENHHFSWNGKSSLPE